MVIEEYFEAQSKAGRGEVAQNESAQDTIRKWIKDGLPKNEAIQKWESFMHGKLPENIANMLPDWVEWADRLTQSEEV